MNESLKPLITVAKLLLTMVSLENLNAIYVIQLSYNCYILTLVPY